MFTHTHTQKKREKKNDNLWIFSVKNESVINPNTFIISITDTCNDILGHQDKNNLNSKKAILCNSS